MPFVLGKPPLVRGMYDPVRDIWDCSTMPAIPVSTWVSFTINTSSSVRRPLPTGFGGAPAPKRRKLLSGPPTFKFEAKRMGFGGEPVQKRVKLTSSPNAIKLEDKFMGFGVRKLRKLSWNPPTPKIEAKCKELGSSIPPSKHQNNILAIGTGSDGLLDIINGMRRIALGSNRVTMGTNKITYSSRKVTNGSSRVTNGSSKVNNSSSKITKSSSKVTGSNTTKRRPTSLQVCESVIRKFGPMGTNSMTKLVNVQMDIDGHEHFKNQTIRKSVSCSNSFRSVRHANDGQVIYDLAKEGETDKTPRKRTRKDLAQSNLNAQEASPSRSSDDDVVETKPIVEDYPEDLYGADD